MPDYGAHRVTLGDVTHGIDALMRADVADVMYCDPPTGDGAIKLWARLNTKNTGQVTTPAPLPVFLDVIFGIASTYVSRYLLIEFGPRWRAEITHRGSAAGFTPRSIIPIRYRGNGRILPFDLHVFTKGAQPLPLGYAEGVAGTMGYATLQNAIRPLAGLLRAAGGIPIILDPCCGLGFTAQAAIDFGMAFRGNELNSTRLAKTIARLTR